MLSPNSSQVLHTVQLWSLTDSSSFLQRSLGILHHRLWFICAYLFYSSIWLLQVTILLKKILSNQIKPQWCFGWLIMLISVQIPQAGYIKNYLWSKTGISFYLSIKWTLFNSYVQERLDWMLGQCVVACIGALDLMLNFKTHKLKMKIWAFHYLLY